MRRLVARRPYRNQLVANPTCFRGRKSTRLEGMIIKLILPELGNDPVIVTTVVCDIFSLLICKYLEWVVGEELPARQGLAYALKVPGVFIKTLQL